jgi:hypothetical protein
MPHNHLFAIMAPVFKKGTSLDLEQFENSLSDINRSIQDLIVSVLLFIAVAYSCARYAVRIEHPWRWYRDTRMRNYNRLS